MIYWQQNQSPSLNSSIPRESIGHSSLDVHSTLEASGKTLWKVWKHISEKLLVHTYCQWRKPSLSLWKLNSCPLCRMDTMPDDGVEALTPAHFLVGRSLQALPAPTSTDMVITASKRWNLCQKLSSDFWDRWSKECLQLLQKRNKWTKAFDNIYPTYSTQGPRDVPTKLALGCCAGNISWTRWSGQSCRHQDFKRCLPKTSTQASSSTRHIRI